MNTPKIRFNGFEGEWKTSLVGDIAPVTGGYAFLSNLFCLTGVPVVRISNILESGIVGGEFAKYNMFKGDESFRLYDGDAVIAMSGATTGKVAVVRTTQFLYQNQRVGKFTKTDTVDYGLITVIVSSQKFRKDLVKLLTYSAQPNASSRDIDSIIEFIPNDRQEQQQIASYFTHLDSLISASTSRLASLKQVKEASLQAMFPQEGETVPKIRFKGFEGEWKKVKLNTFAKRVMRKNSNLESTLALTIASAYGLVSQIDYFNNSVVGANLRNYYLLKKGEFAYNKSYSNGYPFGSVKRLDRYEQGILSTLYIVFSIDDSISSDYLTHFFDTTLWHKDVAERAAEGARNHGLLNIGAVDFLDINIWKPQTKAEQRAIASFFTSLDRRISLETQRLEKLKQIKAACLDKMFV